MDFFERLMNVKRFDSEKYFKKLKELKEDGEKK